MSSIIVSNDQSSIGTLVNEEPSSTQTATTSGLIDNGSSSSTSTNDLIDNLIDESNNLLATNEIITSTNNNNNKNESTATTPASSAINNNNNNNNGTTQVDVTNTNESTENFVLTTIDAKHKKRLDKFIASLSLEDKYYALANKLAESQELNKKLQTNTKDAEKLLVGLTKQRDTIQTEYGKTLLVKTKLESLCRELQRQNKLVKEESIQRIEEEEQKRKDISSRLQTAIDEINVQVASNSEKNSALLQENAQLTAKLKNLIEQYEIREQHIDKVLKHKDLELQLANAKLQQSELKVNEVIDLCKKDKLIYENKYAELNKKCEFHQDAEKQLRSQLTLYTKKYEEFQSTLTKSNQVFESFKAEIDKMTTKIKKLEQETSTWKGKWETCDQTLQRVLRQKEELEEKSKKIQTKADMMEKISRSLQDERNNLKVQTKQLEEKLKAFTIIEEKSNGESELTSSISSNEAETPPSKDSDIQQQVEEGAEEKKDEEQQVDAHPKEEQPQPEPQPELQQQEEKQPMIQTSNDSTSIEFVQDETKSN